LKTLAAVLLLALICLGASPDVAAYPGATVDPALTALNRTHGPQLAELAVYTTADSFEKVDEYYKKIGGQEVPHSRNVVPSMQFVVFRFPGKKFQVGLSRSASDQRHITIVQIYLPKAQ